MPHDVVVFGALQPGDSERIGGYRLVGRLGVGGQGTVYLATDDAGGRVAVKTIRYGLQNDPGARARSEHESQWRAGVPAAYCTAPVLAHGCDGGLPFVVSEFISGPTLADAVRSAGPLQDPALHRLAIGTARALTAIHTACLRG